jgi:intracellular septation protein A
MVPVFVYPFFLLKHLRLRKEQKIGLIGIFSLGTITLIVSLSRFIAYNVTNFELEDESGSTFYP